MARPATDFATRLHSQGFRLTPQRQLIMDAVRHAARHVTPDEVYAAVHRQNPAISRATIYRTLDFLCEMRLIHALYWGGQMYYEIAAEQPHHHLVCRGCGVMVECAPDLLQIVVDVVEKKHRFTIDMDHVALFGLCRHCRGQGKKSKK
ncbi:Ferric uptake regulation protein [Thermoflexales bacterium]|nr:Ferric uptake regulation protein [Thermoflexales bacterium]